MVSSDDTIYIIGDFAFNRIQKHADNLKGRKVFLQGNHDPPNFGPTQLHLNYENYQFTLTHYPRKTPLLANLFPNNKKWVVQAHTNNDLRKHPYLNYKERSVNVSVEATKYYPVNITWLIHAIEQGKNKTFLEL